MSIGYREVVERWLDVLPNRASLELSSPHQILPHLYIGDVRDATNPTKLTSKGIVNVVNCLGPTAGTGIVFYKKHKIDGYLEIASDDASAYPIRKHFGKAFEFIEECRLRGEKVLVHCQAGVSRSGAVALSYIMRHKEMTLRQAIEVVHRERPFVLPNNGFFEQLLAYEKELFALSNGSSDDGVSKTAATTNGGTTSKPKALAPTTTSGSPLVPARVSTQATNGNEDVQREEAGGGSCTGGEGKEKESCEEKQQQVESGCKTPIEKGKEVIVASDEEEAERLASCMAECELFDFAFAEEDTPQAIESVPV